jgi:hypothetical protein
MIESVRYSPTSAPRILFKDLHHRLFLLAEFLVIVRWILNQLPTSLSLTISLKLG